MPSTVWHSPPPGQGLLKRLCLGLPPDAFPSTCRLLDVVAEALKNINGGQLWRIENRLIARTEVSPDAYELPAQATFSNSRGKSTITLEAVADYNIQRTQLGLVMTYALFTDDVAFWTESTAEQVVATTTLITGDTICHALNYHRPQEQDPTVSWVWYNPSCGWMSRTTVLYGGWSIQLGR